MQIRLLPLIILFSLLMLLVKLIDVLQGTRYLTELLIQPLFAETTAAAPPAPASSEVTDLAPANSSLSKEDVEQRARKFKRMQEADAEQNMVNPETQAPLTSCPKSYTPTDIALLQQLGERRKQLEERDNALATKENLLGAASKKVEDKIADLKTLQSKVEDLLVKFGEQEDKKLNSLVKIYENMKPKDAATIFNALEMDVLLMLISKMKELKTAPILAYMDPKRAEAVTVELANQRKTIAPQDGCMVE